MPYSRLSRPSPHTDISFFLQLGFTSFLCRYASFSPSSPCLIADSVCFDQVDYSDMWDIMAFFRGGVNGEGAHDQLGKEIATAGKEWVKECYRWADLEAYQFRFVLPSPLCNLPVNAS